MTKFNPAQLEILKLFELPLSESEMKELKKVLTHFLVERLQNEVSRVWEEKGYSDEQFIHLHERTPYPSK